MTDAVGSAALPPGGWVDGPTAYELAGALDFAAQAARQNGTTLSPRLIAAHAVFRTAGRRWVADSQEAFRQRNTAVPADGGPATISPVTLTADEAGDRLGICARAVRGRAARGSLPGHVVGGRWFFNLADIEDAARARQEQHV